MCVVVVVSVIVKRPVLPPFVVDRRSRNPIYLFIYLFIWVISEKKAFLHSLMVNIEVIIIINAEKYRSQD